MNKRLERWLTPAGKEKADAKRQVAAEALLAPGEWIQASFFAWTLQPLLVVGLLVPGSVLHRMALEESAWAVVPALVAGLSAVYLLRDRQRVILVTSQRIIICARPSRRDPLGLVLRELDRRVPLLPEPGTWGKFEQLGEYYWVSKRHRQDLADADAALAELAAPHDRALSS